MKRIVSVTFLGLALCVLYATISYSRVHGDQRYAHAPQTTAIEAIQEDRNARRISVKRLTSPKMPVTFGYATATGVGKQTVLAYSVTNQTGGQVKNLEVAVFVVDLSGRIKGGEGWESSVDLAANATGEFAAILQSKFDVGDLIVVAIAKATGQWQRFEVEPAELVDSVKAQTVGKNSSVPRVRYMKASAIVKPAGFCETAEARAGAACKCGVSSFSCNETAQTYSYTCFPKTNCLAP